MKNQTERERLSNTYHNGSQKLSTDYKEAKEIMKTLGIERVTNYGEFSLSRIRDNYLKEEEILKMKRIEKGGFEFLIRNIEKEEYFDMLSNSGKTVIENVNEIYWQRIK